MGKKCLESRWCTIFKVIVAGFRGKVALKKNRTLGVPGVVIDKACIKIYGCFCCDPVVSITTYCILDGNFESDSDVFFFFSELSGLGGSGIGRYPLSPKGSDVGEQYQYL